MPKGQFTDRDLSARQSDGLAGPGKVVGALAVDHERREGRRHLLDFAGKAWQSRLRSLLVSVAGPTGDDLALQVERVGLLAEPMVKS
jgi:hypothetical protein